MKINIQLFVVLAVLLFAVSGFRFKSRIQSKLHNQVGLQFDCTPPVYCTDSLPDCPTAIDCCNDCFPGEGENQMCHDSIFECY